MNPKTHESERRWEYSQKRLDELDDLLVTLETKANTYDFGVRVIRFKTKADEAAYDALWLRWRQVYAERDRCQMALWRRRNAAAAVA